MPWCHSNVEKWIQKCIFSTFFFPITRKEQKRIFPFFFLRKEERKDVLPSFFLHIRHLFHTYKKILCLQNLSASFEIQIYNLLSIYFVLIVSSFRLKKKRVCIRFLLEQSKNCIFNAKKVQKWKKDQENSWKCERIYFAYSFILVAALLKRNKRQLMYKTSELLWTFIKVLYLFCRIYITEYPLYINGE